MIATTCVKKPVSDPNSTPWAVTINITGSSSESL